MRVAVLLLALTAALSIWPCAAAPRSLEPEYVRIANAADARLENAVVQELTPPQAMPPSGSSYQNKCRSQRMRFGTQNLRGFRDKAKMQGVRCNMTDRGTAILALQETWYINDTNVSMDDGYRLIGAGNGIRNGNYDSVNGVAFMLSPKMDDDSSQDASYCESERCDENEESEKTTTEEADDREERHVHINLSEIQMPAWENVVYDRAEWAAMLGRIDIQAQ